MAQSISFPIPHNLAELYQSVREILRGKLNNKIVVTLTANAATTTVNDQRIGAETVFGFMPTTSNAAAAVGGLYVSARGKKTATLTHANNAQTDRTFEVTLTG